MPRVYVRLREGGENGGVPIPADGRVRLTPVHVVDPKAWVTSAPTVLTVVGGVAEPVGVSAGRWQVDAVASSWAHRWVLDLEDSADPINLATLTPIDPATPLPWAPTLADLEFIRETRDRIPELIEEAVAEGDYTGPAGRGVESIADDDGDGTATVTYTDGTTATFPLPSGEDGDDGDPGQSAYQLAVAEGFEGTLTEWLESLQGADGPAPDVVWDGSRLVVGGEVGPDLTGPASTVPGPAPEVEWDGPVLVVGGERSPDLTGQPGSPGAPGAIPTAADYTLVGPGRPDQPSTTGGLVTGSTPVGATYTSTDGAGVGAWQWLRTPTGWIVTMGDTGRRAIPTLIDQIPTLYLRRIGWQVWVEWPRSQNSNQLGDRASLVAISTIGGLQGGFGFPSQTPVLLQSSVGGGSVAALIYDASKSSLDIRITGSTAPQWLAANASITTTNAWPSTLPGTPG